MSSGAGNGGGGRSGGGRAFGSTVTTPNIKNQYRNYITNPK